MRAGQALGLRQDFVTQDRRIEIVSRDDNANGARGNGGRGSVPVTGVLVRCYSDHMHLEYGELDSDYVFVNLWGGQVGRAMTYANVNEIVCRTRARVGFHFTPHMFCHYVEFHVSVTPRRCGYRTPASIPRSSRRGSDMSKSKPRRCISTLSSRSKSELWPGRNLWTANPAATAPQTHSSHSWTDYDQAAVEKDLGSHGVDAAACSLRRAQNASAQILW